jgi:anti-sigma B factor antagonist
MFQASRQGAVQVISGSAPLSAENLSLAREACEQCFGKGLPRLVFHLEAVPLIDSQGLELLLDLRDRCLQQGGALQLAAPTVLCRDILQATGLASQLAIFDDLNAAVGSFSQ